MSSIPAEVPTNEIPDTQLIASQTPASQTPASQTPASQTPASQTPASQTPASQTPKSRNIDLNQLFDTKCPPCDQATTGRYIYSVFHSIMALIAIYLAFRCNKGFSLGPFLIACTCPYLYIIYVVATKGTCGILEK